MFQVRRCCVGGWGSLHNPASLRLHLASWNLKDFQSSWKSNMEPSVATFKKMMVEISWLLIYIWSNILYLEIFIKICGIFKILILLPFFIKDFLWAAKCPKPLPIHWRVIEWGVFFKLSFLGCALNAQSWVFLQTFQNTAFFVASLLSL